MMKLHVLILYFIASFTCRSALSNIPDDPFLGIPPQDVEYYYYKSSSGGGGDVIKCRNGSKTFTRAQLNDDFCDCPDASDEPGTSACPNGKFHCQNAGHVSLSLFSSRVNDGICDCCDGSDEYDGKVKCPNTCWEAGKVARDNLKKKIATYQEGVTIRKREIEQAKLAIAKDEKELETLKNDEKILKGLVQQLKERKEQIEKVEEKERLQREKEKAIKEEEEKVSLDKGNEKTNGEEENPTDITNDDKIGFSEESPVHKEVEEKYVDTGSEIECIDDFKSEGSLIDATEKHAMENEEVSAATHKTDLNVVSEASSDSDHHEIQEKDDHENNAALSKEELGRLVASRWTGENTGQETGEVHTPQSHDHEGHEESMNDRHDEEHDGYASDSDSENQKYEYNDTEDQIEEDLEEDHDDSGSYNKPDFDEESDLSDKTSSSESSWLEKIQQTVRNIIESVNFFKAPANISDAAHVRKEYDDSSSKLSEIESRISSLTRKLKRDFGRNKEFYSFYDRCFESKQNKYVYKVCPYKQASQDEGHRTTRLGSWDKFEDSHRAMLFSNGEGCWNGPDRSLKVKLRCGLSNEVTDVDEPSRCEYAALLSTPALCHEEKLKELQEKLVLMNKEIPQSHDEL